MKRIRYFGWAVYDRVIQFNWLYFGDMGQLIPLKLWPNTAQGCNHRPNCIPQVQHYILCDCFSICARAIDSSFALQRLLQHYQRLLYALQRLHQHSCLCDRVNICAYVIASNDIHSNDCFNICHIRRGYYYFSWWKGNIGTLYSFFNIYGYYQLYLELNLNYIWIIY